MEHCFTLALMLLLVGPLQARPTTTTTTTTTTTAPACIELEDLDFDYMDEVKCKPNVTFSCPTNVTCAAAMKCFTEQLKEETTECEDTNARIANTLESLEGKTETVPTSCKWNTEESPKTFHKFMEDFERLIEQINNDTC